MTRCRRSPFLCPTCGKPMVRITDTRPYQGAVRRRRWCPAGHAVWTKEQVIQAA